MKTAVKPSDHVQLLTKTYPRFTKEGDQSDEDAQVETVLLALYAFVKTTCHLHVELDVQTFAKIVIHAVHHDIDDGCRKRSVSFCQRQIWLPLAA